MLRLNIFTFVAFLAFELLRLSLGFENAYAYNHTGSFSSLKARGLIKVNRGITTIPSSVDAIIDGEIRADLLHIRGRLRCGSTSRLIRARGIAVIGAQGRFLCGYAY